MEENSFLCCSECEMICNNFTILKKHVEKRHPTKLHQILSDKKYVQELKYSCNNCNQNFNSARSLSIHRKSCTDPLEIESTEKDQPKTKPKLIDDDSICCSDCELEFEDLITFKNHMRDHRDNKVIKKRKTKNGSTNVQTPKPERKKRKEPQNSFNVKVENETFEEDFSPIRKSKRQRKVISYAHLIESDSEAESESFTSIVNKRSRKTESKHICNECYMEYDNSNDLQKHVRKHHPSKLEKSKNHPKKILKKYKFQNKKFTCEACLKKYNHLSTLRKHIRKYHPTKWVELATKLYSNGSSEKTYTCTECQMMYGNIVGLRKHIRKAHFSKFNELVAGLYKKKPKNNGKKFKCDECQVKYSNLNTLRKHIKEQHPTKLSELLPNLYKKKYDSNKRLITCFECNMKYSNMSGLRKHTRKHHTNKLVELAPLLYTFKRNMAKNIFLKRRNLQENELINSIKEELMYTDKFKCNVCQSSYSNISNLRKHIRKFHPDKLSDIAPLIKDNSTYTYKCDLCPKRYNCPRNFKYHQRKCHPEIGQPSRHNSKPTKINKCPLCEFQNTERKALLRHFKDEHDIEVTMNPVEVQTLDEFLKWKDSFEKDSNTRFVKEYHFSCTSHEVVSYICHRSGYYNPKGKGLRHMKLQGSSKINGYCPAAMKLKKMKDNSVKVTFCGTHIGHATDINHLNLTPAERQIIAEKIAMNIPFKDILDSFQNSVSESDFKRIHMLSKKDLYNIKSSFHLNSPIAKTIKPPSENISFEVWIDDKKNNDCIIFYKKKGECLPEHPNLESDDFVLIIMNQTQRDKLKKFGHDTICIDRSFELNNNHFELTSLNIISETEEGYPCAFLISNRSDQDILSLFFHYIKNNVGVINTNIFMSDMVDYFYKAWISVMPEVQFRLYCTWQIECNWKNKLSSMKSKEKQENLMNKLKGVLEENQIFSFKEKLESVVSELSNETYAWIISDYLIKNYLQNSDLWESKAGPYTDLKFNSHLERMHKTLKHLFLNGKNSKHFGKALGDIMRFIKEKLFDRTILINRGKINNKMKIAIFRHKLSLHSKTDGITETNEGWHVPSSENSEIYTINEIQASCRCEFICPECKCCIHRYLCSCLDSSIKWNMCKHIHLLCRHLNSPEYIKQHEQQQQQNIEQLNQIENYNKTQPQQVVYIKQPQIEFIKENPQIEYVKQADQIEYIKQPHQIKYIRQPTHIEYVKHPQQIEYIKQSQGTEHIQVQHIQLENHVGHVDQVESAYIYCNETNQREMDAILAEVNICNLETVQVAQVTQIPTSCTIQIPTSCTVVPQVTQMNSNVTESFGEVEDTKESLKMKFLKLLEEASSPSELEVVQKMLASITPTLEVIKENTPNQVLFPI